MPRAPQSANSNVYPNVFILRDKYRSVRDVKIGDVIRSFPLTSIGSKSYTNLHFRFETCIYNSLTQMKLVCFKDIYCPDEATLSALNEISAPCYKDKIRLKILLLPESVPKKVIPNVNYEMLRALH